MERTIPEVKLALAAERRLRRAALPLRALLAAAERAASGDDAGAGLLAGPDDLAVLAALLKGPAQGHAPGQVGRSRPSLAPSHHGAATRRPDAPIASGPVARRQLRSVTSGADPETVAFPPHAGIGPGRATRIRALREEPAESHRLSPLSARPDAKSPGPDIADRRAALRKSIAAMPAPDGRTSPQPEAGKAFPPRRPPAGDSPAPKAAIAHALVAAARMGPAPKWQAGTVAAGAAAPWAEPGTLAAAHGFATGQPDRTAPQAQAGDAPEPRSPSKTAASSLRLSSDTVRPPLIRGHPRHAQAPDQSHPAIPAPRPAPTFLADAAGALAEAAWRNGVDLS